MNICVFCPEAAFILVEESHATSYKTRYLRSLATVFRL